MTDLADPSRSAAPGRHADAGSAAPSAPPARTAPVPPSFLWATGIEDTFIAAPWAATERVMDEYALTDHYRQWATDIDLMAELGVSTARYGLPWYRINPAPDHWDWAWADRVLDRLLGFGIAPIIDLMHYGTPPWLDGAFLHPDYPARVADYAARVAARYRGRIRWYTPMNEPRITAWYCGYLGWWPPGTRGWRGFVAVLLAACRGIVATVAALRAVDPEIALLHVDATDLYRPAAPDLAERAAQRQQIVFLALDCITGRVDARHPLRPWLLAHGAAPAVLDALQCRPVALDYLGLNLYPMFTLKHVESRGTRHRIRMRYGSGEMLETLAELYWERFATPLMISETAALGSVRRRIAWLETSVAAVAALRARGIPVFGYTWWPLYSLVAWSYRQGTRPLERYWLHMGLWDVDPGPGLRRVRTPVADAYRALIAGGDAAVGPIAARRRAVG